MRREGHPVGTALRARARAAGRVRRPGEEGRAPILDLGLLKDRSIAGANLTLITVGAFSAGQVLLMTLYLQEGRGLSPLLTGLCFVPQVAGAFALAGRDRRGNDSMMREVA